MIDTPPPPPLHSPPLTATPFQTQRLMTCPATLLLKMEKKNEHLPEEVIIEILLRLPVKSVLRCKCVCKLWLSIISDPHFAISHFQLAASPTHRILFVESYSPKTISIDFNASLNDDSAYHSLSLDFLPHRSYPTMRGSCRGFLLLDCCTCLYLWNPSTGVSKQIPMPMAPIIIADNDANIVDIVKFLYALTYEPSTNDYLIVWGTYADDLVRYEPISSSIDIFSLRANKWKQVEVGSHLPYKVTERTELGARVGYFLNGSIHWLVHNYETRRDVIIAFDLKEMRMSEIALPDVFYRYYRSLDYDLLVFRGLISACIVYFNIVKVWVMQDYAVDASWTRTLVFSTPHAVQFSPISFTNCGDIVGVDDYEGGLMKFNDKGQLLEHCFYHRYRLSSDKDKMTLYTESLLSLPSGADQA